MKLIRYAHASGPRAALLRSDALMPAPRVARVALQMPRKKTDIGKALRREVGTVPKKIFDGAKWVPRGRAVATLSKARKSERAA